MKNLKLMSALAICLLLAGCSETPTLYNSNNYNGNQ